MSNGLPDLKSFYFDRVWLKAYPAFFSNLRDSSNFEAYRNYRDAGVFRDMTDCAFKLYRTLDLIKRGVDEGYSINDIPNHASELRRYGDQDYYEFNEDGDKVAIHVDNGSFKSVVKFRLDQVMSVKFIEYVTVIRDKLHYEKSIYMELAPYVRIGVKPFVEGFVPPMIRVFYNPLIRAKLRLGLGDFGYEHEHDNYVDPDAVDSRFIELNHKYAFDRNHLSDLIRKLWRIWFCRDEFLRIKVTQVELSYDSKVPKDKLLMAFHVLGGRAKTIKSSADDVKYIWVDSGAKYYVTVRKGLQVKLYTKAWKENKFLNRVEYTFNVNKDLDDVSVDDVLKNGELREIHMSLIKALTDPSVAVRIEEMLKPFIECTTNCEKHYAFWVDLLMTGQVKGSQYFKEVARVYRRKGLIKVSGRGRNSVYVINDSVFPFSNLVRTFREFFGIVDEQ